MDLRKYLRLRGIKVLFMAKQLGIHRITLYRYMAGKCKTPRQILLAVKHLTSGKVTQVLDKKKKLPKKQESIQNIKT